MNDKLIFAIVEQVRPRWTDEDSASLLYTLVGEHEIRKFAELLVNECAKFVESKFDLCGDEIVIAEQIIKHFGVSE